MNFGPETRVNRRCGTTQSENNQFCERQFPEHTQYTGGSSKYGTEPQFKNFQTRKIVCRWNRSLYIYHCGGICSQYVLLYVKIRQLEAGKSDAPNWMIPSVKFVFDCAKVARPSSDPFIEPTTTFACPIFTTHLHGYNIFTKFYPYGIGPATGKGASNLFTLFPGNNDILHQWPFLKPILIGIRDKLDPLNTGTKTIQSD